MSYQLYDIESSLKPFVKVICSIEYDESTVASRPIRVLPDACVELFINVGEPQQVASRTGIVASSGKSFITSRMNQFMDVRSRSRVSFLSVCFRDGAAYPFFRTSMHDVANQVVDLRDLWCPVADELQERIEQSGTMAQRVQLIQRYLIAKLQQSERTDKTVDFCIRQIKQANGKLSLEELANSVGISNRQLVRRFNQFIGLSPKEFARMTTFLKAMRQLKQYSKVSLTEIAYESGYYDQAHFIHDCRDFSGLTPSRLLNTDAVLC